MSVLSPEIGAPGNSSASSDEVFDIPTLLRRCMDDAELAVALVERFASRLEATMQSIRRLLDEKNWAAAASTVHSLKGEAGSLAAAELHAVAETLEQSLRNQEPDCLPKYERLQAAATVCVAASEGVLKRLSELAATAAQ